MAEATLAGFRQQFPSAFASTADADVERTLAEARQIHDVRERATYYLTAHLLTLDARTDTDGAFTAGEVKSEKAGDLTISYATVADSAFDREDRTWFYRQTIYGQRFLQLEHRTPRTAIGAFVAS